MQAKCDNVELTVVQISWLQNRTRTSGTFGANHAPGFTGLARKKLAFVLLLLRCLSGVFKAPLDFSGTFLKDGLGVLALGSF